MKYHGTTEQWYDGEGRVVKQVEDKQYEYQGTPSGLTTTGYRVFSSVLGGELVSIETDQTGERRKVKVYAGEAVVGERSQRTLTGQSPTQAFGFFHADPVTGETSNKVFDALGQVVETTLLEDPDPEPFPPPENLRPGFGEWRCNVAAAFGQTFYEMPHDCRKAFHNETWKVRFVKKEGDATAISKTAQGHESLHTFDRETSVSDTVLNRTIRSTDKPSAKFSGAVACPKGQVQVQNASGEVGCAEVSASVEVSASDPSSDLEEFVVDNKSFINSNSFGTWTDLSKLSPEPPSQELGILSQKQIFIEDCIKKRISKRVSTIMGEREKELDTNLLWSMSPTYGVGIPGTPISLSPTDWLPETTLRNKNVAGFAAFVGIAIPGKAGAGLLVQGGIEATKGRANYMQDLAVARRVTSDDKDVCNYNALLNGFGK